MGEPMDGEGRMMTKHEIANGPRHRWTSIGAAMACALLVACAGPRAESEERPSLSVEESPLGGEALTQRKQDLRRAYGDVIAFQTTMSSLIDRRDTRALSSLDGFVGQYLDRHLDALLAPAWQSGHPEVMEVDANLRFAKADLLVKMRYPRRVQAVIDDIEKRYKDRANMLVEYPVGEQNTIAEAMVILRSRKWNG
jgi:hypothetical protein